MKLKEFTKILYGLIEVNDFKSTFRILKDVLDVETKKYSICIQLLGEYNDFEEIEMINVHKSEENSTGRNKIRRSIIILIRSISQSDLSTLNINAIEEITNKRKVILNPILILTREESIAHVTHFFRLLEFENAEVKSYVSEYQILDNYDFIIFDNRDLLACFSKGEFEKLEEKDKLLISGRIQKMESTLKNSSKIIIHFGDMLYWVNSNRNRVQAANSKFSLHARTKEVIDFINTYRV